MSEGGQSATGQARSLTPRFAPIVTQFYLQLIEYMLTSHPAYPLLEQQAAAAKKPVHTILTETLDAIRTEEGARSLTELTRHLHFYPDLHGAPFSLADSSVIQLQYPHPCAAASRRTAIVLMLL